MGDRQNQPFQLSFNTYLSEGGLPGIAGHMRRHFRVCPYAEEAELAPPWAAGVAQDGEDKKPSNGGRWMYNRWRPGSQNGNPALNDDVEEVFRRWYPGFRPQAV